MTWNEKQTGQLKNQKASSLKQEILEGFPYAPEYLFLKYVNKMDVNNGTKMGWTIEYVFVFSDFSMWLS